MWIEIAHSAEKQWPYRSEDLGGPGVVLGLRHGGMARLGYWVKKMIIGSLGRTNVGETED